MIRAGQAITTGSGRRLTLADDFAGNLAAPPRHPLDIFTEDWRLAGESARNVLWSLYCASERGIGLDA